MMRIALIGYGGIAGTLVRLLHEQAGGRIDVVAALIRSGRQEAAQERLGAGVTLVERVADLPSVDLVVEAAGQQALAQHGVAVLQRGWDLLVSSIGALADGALMSALTAACHPGRIILPAGAVGGIDALAAMRLAGLQRVCYRSRKPPSAWVGTPADQLIDLSTLSAAAVFYRGSATEAALAYPKNANVAATVALAGLGFDQTEVELIADPSVTHNIHEIEADGASGRFVIRLEGVPSPENPKTSALTALSVARTLINRVAPVVI